MPTLAYLFAAVFGLLFGSFANVLTLRDDRRLSILTGRSECPNCHHELAWFELIPVLSFVVLGGRCRKCRRPISWQYPLVELLNALLWMLAAYFGLSHGSIAAGVLLALCFTCLLVISAIDVRTQMVSLEYCAAALLLGAAGMLAAHTLTPLEELAGLLLGGGSIAAIILIWKLATGQDGMGTGDIWIAAAVGAVAGWPSVIIALLAAVVAGAVIGLVYAGAARRGINVRMPFGPFLAAGLLVALAWGQAITQWYILQL